VHCALIGKLAVSKQYQRQGFGSILIIDAIRQAITPSATIPIPMIIIDAKIDTAKDMYINLGFTPFPENEYRLFMTMKTAKAMIEKIDNESFNIHTFSFASEISSLYS